MRLSRSLRPLASLWLSGLALACAGESNNGVPATPQQTAKAPEPEGTQTPTPPPAPSVDPARENAPPGPTAATTEPTPVPLTDPQIAAITDGANSAEIEQAKLARAKSKDPRIQKFASMMLAHHSEAQKKQESLQLKTAESPLSAELLEEANQTLATLKQATGSEFDKAYVKAQVDEHEKVLDVISNKLLPAVKGSELRGYLDEIKPKVAQHLEAARTLLETSSPSKVDNRGPAASPMGFAK